jgi:hypothetical protein
MPSVGGAGWAYRITRPGWSRILRVGRFLHAKARDMAGGRAASRSGDVRIGLLVFRISQLWQRLVPQTKHGSAPAQLRPRLAIFAKIRANFTHFVRPLTTG